MSAFLSPIEPAGQDISPASHVPLSWRSGEPRADTGAKGSHVAADAARKNTLSKHAAPRLRAAFCHEQSTITWLLTHSHDTSPSSAAAGFGRHCSLIHTIPAPQQQSAVCRGHSLIHMIPAPHQAAAGFGRHCSLIHMIPAPQQRSAMCRGHSLIHMIPVPRQRLPCVEDTRSFTDTSPTISGYRG